MQYLMIAGGALLIELGGVLFFTGLLYIYEKFADLDEKAAARKSNTTLTA